MVLLGGRGAVAEEEDLQRWDEQLDRRHGPLELLAPPPVRQNARQPKSLVDKDNVRRLFNCQENGSFACADRLRRLTLTFKGDFWKSLGLITLLALSDGSCFAGGGATYAVLLVGFVEL